MPIIDNERNKSSDDIYKPYKSNIFDDDDDDLFDTDIWGNKKKKCC